jgi:sugar lactone lactonase YvrE
MSATYGGLDPSDHRGFARIRDTPRFRAIVATIRRRNPPVTRSRVAYTLVRRGLFPEGMAFDPATRRVYAGSVTGKQIVWTDSTRTLHELVRPGQDRLGIVAGLHVDARRHHLWAVSSGATGPGSGSVIRGLVQYDLTTGQRIGTFKLPDTTSMFTINDVVVVPSTGVAYTTHTGTGALSAAIPGRTDLIEFLPAGSIPGANGLAVTPDEAALLVAGDAGIYRVDLRRRRAQPLEKPADVVDGSIDGLYRHGNSLIAIQNGIHPGRVMRFDLDPGFTRILRSEVLETYNPAFETPTTGAMDGDSFVFMANPQLRRWNAGQSAIDSTTLKPVLVMRLSLK